jgi:hypothetical protein
VSDSFWYWRIAKGSPGTDMPDWEKELSPDEIWKVMVYENTFDPLGPRKHSLSYEEALGNVKKTSRQIGIL